MSLIQKAKDHTLPEIQYMDKETLVWIIENKPDFSGEGAISLDLLNLVSKYTPAREWFLNDEIFDSIHGMRHTLRVVLGVAQLFDSRHSIGSLFRNCLIAASLHDVRRLNDKGDVGHGERAALWFQVNYKLVAEKYAVVFTLEDILQISTAIALHEVPYTQISEYETYEKNFQIVDILKTADALDRYRLPKLSWWINDTFVKIIPTDKEKAFAYSEVVRTEQSYLRNRDSISSIFDNS